MENSVWPFGSGQPVASTINSGVLQCRLSAAIQGRLLAVAAILCLMSSGLGEAPATRPTFEAESSWSRECKYGFLKDRTMSVKVVVANNLHHG